MNKEHSEYQHPKHDAIVAGIERGLTNTAIAANVKCDRRAVARVRDIMGLPPMTNSTSKGAKLDRFTVSVMGGHVMWLGRVNNAGVPTIRHRGKDISAAAVAFERRTGHAPVGMSRADCDVFHCLAPAHVLDDVERRTVRLQLRALKGLSGPWDRCPEGHAWWAYGRVEPDLTLYCLRCNTERATRTRTARKEEGTA